MDARTRRTTWLAGIAVLSGLSLAGCPSGATLDLNALVPQAVDLLNQVTAEDVVAGFEDFAREVENGFDDAEFGEFADEVAGAIADLQEAFDAGDIDGAAFELAVQDLIDREFDGHAFVGSHAFGGPFGHHFGRRLARLLDLTEDQIAATRAIHQMLHADIRAFRQQARQDIRAILTDDQLAELDSIFADHDFGDDGEDGSDEADDGDDKDDIVARHRHPHRPRVFIRILRLLDLTDDQIEAIRDIRQQLRMDVRALHQAARDDFLALLTPEQLDILEQIRDHFMDDDHHADDGDDEDDDGDDDDSDDAGEDDDAVE